MLGGGGCAGPAFGPAPFLLWGGRGSKRSAPLFPGPQGEPAHGLHPRFVVAEIWADRVTRGGGGGASRHAFEGGEVHPPPAPSRTQLMPSHYLPNAKCQPQ